MWCALASACSTFDPEFPATPAPATDGGDASDANAPTDSGLDSADAASRDSCVPFVFSSTFDDPNSLGDWVQVLSPMAGSGNVDAGARPVVVTGALPDGEAPFSAPAALLASWHLPDAGLRAFAEYRLMYVPSSIHLKYKLSVPSTTSYAEVGCDLLFSDGQVGAARIDTFMSAGQLFARRSNADGSEMPFSLIGAQPKDWISVDITANVDGDAGVATATVNDAGLPPVILPAGAKEAFVQCGIGYADFGGPATSGPDLIEVVIDDFEISGCY